MRSNLKILVMIAFATVIYSFAKGQVEGEFDLTRLLKESKVTVYNRTVTPGIEATKNYVTLSQEIGEGLVWINGVSFSTGTIEIDLKGQDVFQHSFLGVAFHGINDSTFDAVYFRPFQWRADDPTRRGRGVQYISLPAYTWQRLRQESSGIYEKPIDPVPDPDNWFHARIVVKEKEALVYVDNAAAPCLDVPLLGDRKSGMIGLYTADQSGGTFANLGIHAK